MKIFCGPRAWSYLRCDRHYVAMSRRHFAAHGRAPEYEDGAPFSVRIQSDADRAAVEEWRLLAVQDPLDEEGPISPFWADAPMLEGVGSATAPPLLSLLAEAGATLEGLRLMDGRRPRLSMFRRACSTRAANRSKRRGASPSRSEISAEATPGVDRRAGAWSMAR